MTTTVQLQKEIGATERAIRHLIGERAALGSKLDRERALLKMEQARLHKLEHSVPALAVASRFPDVSNNNGTVDVGTVKRAGGSVRVGELLVTKITEGTNFVDRPGIERARAMTPAGFERRGFYCFLHPSVGGLDQANFLLETLHGNGIELTSRDILIGDCEVSDGEPAAAVAACAKAFGLQLQAQAPAQRWLYSGGPFAQENGLTLDGFDWHWLAAYVSNPAPFEFFKGRTKAWQFTDGHLGPSPHDCPGIGPCDLSVVLR